MSQPGLAVMAPMVRTASILTGAPFQAGEPMADRISVCSSWAAEAGSEAAARAVTIKVRPGEGGAEGSCGSAHRRSTSRAAWCRMEAMLLSIAMEEQEQAAVFVWR